MARGMAGTPPNDGDPKVIFKLEAVTGEVFEVGFSLRGIFAPNREIAEIDFFASQALSEETTRAHRRGARRHAGLRLLVSRERAT